jgi:Putative Flp pilus-assembly TadE/G-like
MAQLHHFGAYLSRTAKRFTRDEGGNIGLLFGLTLAPMLAFAGAAVDYSRASQARSQLAAAADSAVLAVARRAPTLSDAQLKAEAQTHFRAVLNQRADLAALPITVTRNGNRVQITAAGAMPTTFMKLLGYDSLDVATRVEAGFGDRKAEVVLVLDNTGSMRETGPSGGPRKIDELKKATRNLITAAEAAAPAGSGMIKVGIVPFETEVRVDPSTYGTRSWLAYSSGDPAFADLGSRMATSTNWKGCLSDRGPGFDANDKRTEMSRPDSFHPAVGCASPDMLAIQPLSDSWGTLRTATDLMRPGGYTNVTIGVRFGMAMLAPGDVLDSSAAPLGDAKTDKFLIILTDGENTENRYGRGNTAAMDAKTLAMCNDIKTKPLRADGKPAVTVYTVRLIKGNIDMLKSCASDPSKYKEVNDASQLDAVFKDIIKEITALRLTM